MDMNTEKKYANDIGSSGEGFHLRSGVVRDGGTDEAKVTTLRTSESQCMWQKENCISLSTVHEE